MSLCHANTDTPRMCVLQCVHIYCTVLVKGSSNAVVYHQSGMYSAFLESFFGDVLFIIYRVVVPAVHQRFLELYSTNLRRLL